MRGMHAGDEREGYTIEFVFQIIKVCYILFSGMHIIVCHESLQHFFIFA